MIPKPNRKEWIAAIVAALGYGVAEEAIRRFLQLPLVTALLAALCVLLPPLALACIVLLARYNKVKRDLETQRHEIEKSRQETDKYRLEADRLRQEVFPLGFSETLGHLDSDGEQYRSQFQFTYLLIHHKALINKDGDYDATYLHEAINDSGKEIAGYTYILRTTRECLFKDLGLKARVQIDNEGEVEVEPQNGNPTRTWTPIMEVRVPFPNGRRIGNNTHFKVTLTFLWKGTINPGRDGDAVDFKRFKAVNKAVLELIFDLPVDQAKWCWLNPVSRKLDLYPHQPEQIDPEGRRHRIELPHPEKSLHPTVYGFICNTGIVRDGV